MSKSKSVSERLKVIKLQSELIKKNSNLEKNKNELNENFEEYPKLRKPKPDTLLKIRAHQIKEPAAENGKISLKVPLRQEFLNKKEQLEKATTNFLKKYEMRKSQGHILDDDMFSQDSDESQHLTLHRDLDLRFKLLDVKSEKSLFPPNLSKSLNYIEQHIVNILHTKVQAHPNGFFSANLPHWYYKTFDKDLPTGWLELLEKSNRFYIENIQNKIVLYTKNNCDDPLKNSIDINASGDNPQKVLSVETKEPATSPETPERFVR